MTRIQLLDGPPPSKSRSRSTRVFTLTFLVVVLVVTIHQHLPWPHRVLNTSLGALISSQSSPNHWPGWAGIKHMVVFGDSITTSKFNVYGKQPSTANPLGNPEFPGHTTAISSNWVSFLTATYNATFLKTLNLAHGGATIDEEFIESTFPMVRSFKDQIERMWLAHYTPPTQQFNWTAQDTLFTTFFGSNDIHFTNSSTSLGESIGRYVSLLDLLYQHGARNFLVLNVPPFERAPILDKTGDEAVQRIEGHVTAFNNNLTRAISQFSNFYSDAAVFMFDTNTLFGQLLDRPCSYEETCAIQDTTSYCEAYRREEEDEYKYDAKCKYSADKYFWLNPLHPSFRVHNATAKAIAAYLSGVSSTRLEPSNLR